jgi:hypothetical protein
MKAYKKRYGMNRTYHRAYRGAEDLGKTQRARQRAGIGEEEARSLVYDKMCELVGGLYPGRIVGELPL